MNKKQPTLAVALGLLGITAFVKMVAKEVEFQMNRKRVSHNGHIIEARPYLLRDDGRWSTDLDIERHYGSGFDVWPCSDARTHETREEAIQYCFALGADIIDGRVLPRSIQ